ncbi:MAG: hypothetical protein MJE66_24980 [Proteobacteria bacterium]|nr:hypothetical protein [Pseudomonadota bacterium]
MKTVPMSVRVTPDDAEFIARLRVEGATTPSDKIRSLLAAARRRQQGYGDYAECLAMVQETLAEPLARLRQAERREHVHSELVQSVSEWMPEAHAFLLTSLSNIDENGGQEALVELEEELVDRVFRLLETTLRMGVTRECRGYDPEIVSRHLERILDLAEVIRATR